MSSVTNFFDWRQVTLERPELLATPRLLVFREAVEANIRAMRASLESVVPGSGFGHLAPHVKTHKSLWAARLLVARGIDRLKCSLNELDLCLDAGARSVFVAYPLLPHDADRVARAAAQHSRIEVLAQVGCLVHAERLAAAARRHGIELECLVDVDVGNHRTGVAPGDLPDLVRAIRGNPRLGTLRLRGLHAYDGHNSSPDPLVRKRCAQESMQLVVDCVRAMESAGARVDHVVVGGTPGYLPDLEELVVRHQLDAHVDVSPGTWVYWDTNYEAKLPGLFRYAAFCLAQVIDRPGKDLATLNLGHKRWAIDHGAVTLFNLPGVEVKSTSEEHTVLKLPAGVDPAVEDRVFFVPRHVCPTVNLWEHFTLVGPGGRVETLDEPVTARNR